MIPDRFLVDWLRDNDKSATVQVAASPSVFNLGQRDWFSIDAELAAGSQRPEQWEGLEYGCMWNAASAASVNLDSGAAQGSGGEGNGWASHFANLYQTESSVLDRQIMARQRVE